jgi:assimilatory nitrate reductase catalytic subunit
MALLAGLDPAGGKAEGKIVCACFSISEDSICNAIRDGGLTTPASVGKALKAGTNCGSCIPEIKKLISANAPSRVT